MADYTINALQEYLFQADFKALDYDFAIEHYKQLVPSAPEEEEEEPALPDVEDGEDNNEQEEQEEQGTGACSTIKSGTIFGRNFDWVYNHDATFVVNVDRGERSKYKSVGVTGTVPGMTKDFVNSGLYSENYKLIPFCIVDGINEKGLAVSTNVVPLDHTPTTKTIPFVSEKISLCSIMLPRYILDNFASVGEAVAWLQQYASVFFPASLQAMKYEQHWLISDKDTSICLEVIDNRLKVIDDCNYITNFYIDGVTFNQDGTVYTPATLTLTETPMLTNGITEHGAGLERYNLIVEKYGDLKSESDMRRLLNELDYVRAYETSKNPAEPRWDTEFVGEAGTTVDSPSVDYDIPQNVAGQMYDNTSRDIGDTWHTRHSSVYDLEKVKLKLRIDGKDIEFKVDTIDEIKGVVPFDKEEFLELYPQFVGLSDAVLAYAFDTACTIVNNTPKSLLPYNPEKGIMVRKLAIYLMMCHILTLYKNGPGAIGIMTSATEGSVSAGFSLPQSLLDAGWLGQTQCGLTFLQLVRPYLLGGRYYAPCFCKKQKNRAPWA